MGLLKIIMDLCILSKFFIILVTLYENIILEELRIYTVPPIRSLENFWNII